MNDDPRRFDRFDFEPRPPVAIDPDELVEVSDDAPTEPLKGWERFAVGFALVLMAAVAVALVAAIVLGVIALARWVL